MIICITFLFCLMLMLLQKVTNINCIIVLLNMNLESTFSLTVLPLSAMTTKIVERSPVKHNLVRFASSLLPASVLNSNMIAQRNFSGLLEIFFETCNISSGIADSAKNQYINLCQCAQNDNEVIV